MSLNPSERLRVFVIPTASNLLLNKVYTVAMQQPSPLLTD